jgi:arylsulfatase A-like enzyme
MPDRPNVLFILTDQHRLEAVGCYADTPCRTPNIDRLADEGVRFENAYTTCPVCTPARSSLITGQYPHATGMTENVGNTACAVHSVPDRPELLPRRLGAAGYDCGYNGKWHLSPDSDTAFGVEIDPALPSDRGFEGLDFPGHGGGGWDYELYRDYLDEHGYEYGVEELGAEYPYGTRAGVFQGPEEATVPYFLAERAIDLLEQFRGRDRPFFVWHNFWGPHEPYYPTEAYLSLYDTADIEPWPNFDWPAEAIPGAHHNRLYDEAATTPWEDWAAAVRHYYAFTTMIDAQVGRLLDYLERSGLLEETLVVFAADHGETLGSHGGLFDKGFHHFEEIMHVPLVVRFPDGRWANTAREALVSLADLYPTFLDAAGAERDPGYEHGRSLYDLFDGDSGDSGDRGDAEWREAVCMEFHGLGDNAHSQRTVRRGDLKYGWNPGARDELYDLSVDPAETRNLIDESGYADELRQCREALASWQAETDDPLSLPSA